MKILVNTLEGAMLDRVVALSEGFAAIVEEVDGVQVCTFQGRRLSYSTDWTLASPLMARRSIKMRAMSQGALRPTQWHAELLLEEYELDGHAASHRIHASATSPIVAAMRCVAGASLGTRTPVGT